MNKTKRTKITGQLGIDYIVHGKKKKVKIAECPNCKQKKVIRIYGFCGMCAYRLYPKFREYDKKWYRKNKLRLRKHQKEKIKTAKQMLGNKCLICGRRVEDGDIIFHRKDGKKHGPLHYKIFKESEKYVLLCRPKCHDGVHFCMNHLKMSWEDLGENLNYLKSISENTR